MLLSWKRVFEKCGIHLIASFSGNSTIQKFENAHTADLNMVMCHRSINYVAEMMETAFGIPWIKVQPIGADSTAKMLRKIGQYFGEQELIDKIEEVIAEEMVPVIAAREKSVEENKRQDSNVVCGRIACSPLPEFVRRIRHDNPFCRLRVRSPRRLRRPCSYSYYPD